MPRNWSITCSRVPPWEALVVVLPKQCERHPTCTWWTAPVDVGPVPLRGGSTQAGESLLPLELPLAGGPALRGAPSLVFEFELPDASPVAVELACSAGTEVAEPGPDTC